MANQLTDKVAIVTGSSAGLGEAIAIMFASRGAKVALCGRDEERLRSVFDKVVEVSGGHKDRFITVQGDVNEPNVRNKIVDQTVAKFGRLDILVANVGIILPNQSLLTATEETYNGIMDTNLKSAFFLIQQAVPHLEKTKGNIINISSCGTSLAIPAFTISLLSKVALDHLTRCLAVDLGPKGIRVNSVNPGYFPTRAFRYFGLDVNEKPKLTEDEGSEKHPLKGRSGHVDDVAEAVTFLASEAAGFITGELIRVDGGSNLTGLVGL